MTVPCHPPVPVFSSFSGGAKEALTGRKIFRYFNQVVTVVMLFETGGVVILNNTQCFRLYFFLTILSPDYPNLFMY